MALLNPGDEVILFEPFYAYHVQAILAVEAVPIYVTMRFRSGRLILMNWSRPLRREPKCSS